MRRLLQTSLIIGLLYIATTVAPALAGSCTERQQVCYAYCEKTMPNSPGCRDTARASPADAGKAGSRRNAAALPSNSVDGRRARVTGALPLRAREA